MSTSIDQVFVKMFETEVHEAYQREGSMLRNFVRLKTGVVGVSTHFPKVGRGVATTKSRHGLITPANIDHTRVEVTLTDLYHSDWVDKLDEMKINFDERGVLVRAGAWALGRALDDQIFAALDSTSEPIKPLTVTTSTTVRNSMLNIITALRENDVRRDTFVVLTENAWAAALTVKEFASADYVTDRPFDTGATIKNWNNALWMSHNGCPGAGTATAKGFAWTRSAVGVAEGQGVTTDITWHGDRAAHFVANSMSTGAGLIDTTGVIEISIDDTAALPTA